MMTQLNSFGITDVGCQRSANEDQYLLSELNQAIVANTNHKSDSDSLVTDQTILMAVADGLGGREGGGIASELAVDSLGCFAQQHELDIRRESASELLEILCRGIESAAQTINLLSAVHSTKHLMATTLTAALIRYPDLMVAHVGDSRCYLYRNGRLKRLTHDHTVAELYSSQGQLDSQTASQSPMRHVLWNCLGGLEATFQVEKLHHRLNPNDWVLLCTDGLGRHVSDSEIEQIIGNNPSPRTVCKQLKEIAINRGGNDNLTIVACN